MRPTKTDLFRKRSVHVISRKREKSNPYPPTHCGSLDRVGTYVAFEEVQFIDAEIGLSWSEAETDTDRHLVDRSGDTLLVRTSRYADFADWILPSGSGYIEGILGYFNGTCQLKVVVPKNVVMESPRFGGVEAVIDFPDSPVAACSTTGP